MVANGSGVADRESWFKGNFLAKDYQKNFQVAERADRGPGLALWGACGGICRRPSTSLSPGLSSHACRHLASHWETSA